MTPRNNLDLIRLVAASLVIFSHAYLVTAQFGQEPLHRWVGFLNLGSLAVYTFFLISGYLITASMFKRMNLGEFVLARILRIFPALAVCSVACALLGGLLSQPPASINYFGSAAVYRFAFGNATLLDMQPFLPGVFESNPYPRYVNSPLWTLKGEILMYGLVFIVGAATMQRRDASTYRRHGLLLVAVALYLASLRLNAHYLIYQAAPWILFFCCGMLAYALRRSLPLKLDVTLALWILVAGHAASGAPGLKASVAVSIAYSLLVLAFHPRLQTISPRRYGDFSYGLYIYAFPIQQCMASAWPGQTPIANFATSFPVALLLSVVSWHLVEKPALNLKDSRWLRRRLGFSEALATTTP